MGGEYTSFLPIGSPFEKKEGRGFDFDVWLIMSFWTLRWRCSDWIFLQLGNGIPIGSSSWFYRRMIAGFTAGEMPTYVVL